MSDTVISVKNISKRYKLGSINRRTLKDDIKFRFLKLTGRDPSKYMGKLDAAAPVSNPEFWALRDVSFDVKKGEVMVLGRNGAGKSTLLKYSRIKEPTNRLGGNIGRVGSLLRWYRIPCRTEGRENIS